MSLVGFKAQNHSQQTAKRGARDDVDDRGTGWDFIQSLEARFGAAFTLDVAAAKHNAKAPAYYTLLDDGLRMSWSKAAWQGPECSMCNGSGRDAVAVTGEHKAGVFTTVVGHMETDAPCRGCNGHGREATDEPHGRERVWCNPPYSDCGAWVRKAWAEWNDDNRPKGMRPELIAMLLPANRVEQGWWQDLVEPFRDRPGSPLTVEFLRGRMRFDRPGVEIGPKGDRPPFGCALLLWRAPSEVSP